MTQGRRRSPFGGQHSESLDAAMDMATRWRASSSDQLAHPRAGRASRRTTNQPGAPAAPGRFRTGDDHDHGPAHQMSDPSPPGAARRRTTDCRCGRSTRRSRRWSSRRCRIACPAGRWRSQASDTRAWLAGLIGRTSPRLRQRCAAEASVRRHQRPRSSRHSGRAFARRHRRRGPWASRSAGGTTRRHPMRCHWFRPARGPADLARMGVFTRIRAAPTRPAGIGSALVLPPLCSSARCAIEV